MRCDVLYCRNAWWKTQQLKAICCQLNCQFALIGLSNICVRPFLVYRVTILWAFENLWKKLLASSYLSVCPSVRPSSRNNLASNERIFMQYDIWVFLENLYRGIKSPSNLTIIMLTLHEDLSTFMISRWILPKMRNVSDKCRRENQIHFMFNKLFFFENRAFYEKEQNFCTAVQVTDDITAHAHCMLDT